MIIDDGQCHWCPSMAAAVREVRRGGV